MIWPKMIYMFLTEARFPSSGVPRKLYFAERTLLLVMCGAMAACSMRYGALDINPLKPMTAKRSVMIAILMHNSSSSIGRLLNL